MTGRRSRHVLENLRCGTKYQISVTAFNPAGRSKPSDLVAAATAGNGWYPQVTSLLPPSPSSVPRLTSHFSRGKPWMPGEENKGRGSGRGLSRAREVVKRAGRDCKCRDTMRGASRRRKAVTTALFGTLMPAFLSLSLFSCSSLAAAENGSCVAGTRRSTARVSLYRRERGRRKAREREKESGNTVREETRSRTDVRHLMLHWKQISSPSLVERFDDQHDMHHMSGCSPRPRVLLSSAEAAQLGSARRRARGD